MKLLKINKELQNIILECLAVDLKYNASCICEKGRATLDFHELDVFAEPG